ncbi:hypothetical protein NBO_10g0062 [Nosema bombycis CQ1]|uniref:Uncharacterized protein n=1 Tax=Nosema bombycis (strain CQ1 / CVCC 102059) TaxID=578461 RepID=R0KXY1_NOSB1|nr:hypothetical protein NBO_10g0062 [Nosema bombycis CQ1]|eukprot:EOB15072.1 hypothetical protein NBO_10g0062 [Nosema bombycis CQ1]
MAFMRFRIYFSIINVTVNCSILYSLGLHEFEMVTHEGHPSAVIRPSTSVHSPNTTSRVNLPMSHQQVITDRVNLPSDQPPPYEVAIKLVNPVNVAEFRSIDPPKYEDTLDQTCSLFNRSSPENKEARESQKQSRLGLKGFKKFCYKFAIIFTLLLIFLLGVYLFIFISPIGGIVLGTISIAVLVFYLQLFVCNYY